jgi:hypothetical protein
LKSGPRVTPVFNAIVIIASAKMKLAEKALRELTRNSVNNA